LRLAAPGTWLSQVRDDRRMDVAASLPSPCVVVLVGAGAAGKSTWAGAHAPAGSILSSDDLRALVGSGEDDIGASADAFALLELAIRARLSRRLTTVVDTLGLDVERRLRWLGLARDQQMPCFVVAFDTPPAQCRARNRARPKRIPVEALDAQLRSYAAQRAGLEDEGFDRVLTAEPLRIVAEPFVDAPEAASRQRTDPLRMRFGLHISEFPWPPNELRGAVASVAARAEAAGFEAIWVMDHFRQIPQIGRAWDDMPESWTTLAYLAGVTERIGLGTLVTGITYRNVAHLAKIVATLDVLSGGRARCGLGLGWFEQEHRAYGWDFPSTARRYAVLEDALQLLPMMWGPGSPPFDGKVLRVPETMCYPRPLQHRIPVLVGGNGERRTLELAARYADACNVMGDRATVRHKAEVLREHCARVGRDPADVAVTHLSTVLVGDHDRRLEADVERLRPRGRSAQWFAKSVHAGTVDDQIGRFRSLADAGVSEVMLRLANISDVDAIDRMAKVIHAFS
jgi:F420-dependent oxidoreductase-like protein